MGLMLSACSDFLDRKPLTQPDNTTFLSGREQVENYINALYPALPAPAQYGMGVRGEEVNSDNILAEKYDMRLNGEIICSAARPTGRRGMRTCVMSTISSTIIVFLK